jgi:hypothetical protein
VCRSFHREVKEVCQRWNSFEGVVTMKRPYFVLLIVFVLLAFLGVPSLGAGPIRDSIPESVKRVSARSQVVDFEDVQSPRHQRERFLGTTNVLLASAVLGTGSADIESTLACYGMTVTRTMPLPNGGAQVVSYTCEETNPLARPFIKRGRLAAYVGGAGAAAVIVVPSYYARRSDNKFLKVAGYVLPIAWSIVETRVTIHNIHTRSQMLSYR